MEYKILHVYIFGPFYFLYSNNLYNCCTFINILFACAEERKESGWLVKTTVFCWNTHSSDVRTGLLLRLFTCILNVDMNK